MIRCALSLLASCFIHGAVIVLASIILKHTVSLRRQDFLPISLVDAPRQEQPKPIERVETPPEIKKPPPPPKVEKSKEPKPVTKSEIVQPKPHHHSRQPFPKRSQSSPSKRNPLKPPNLSPLPKLPPGRRRRQRSAAPAIFLAKATWRLSRDRVPRVAAEAPLALVWAEDRVFPAFRRRRRRSRPIGRPSRFKPSVLSTRRSHCAWAWKVT